MIDPLLSLAFGMQSNKGVYAVLLGSGVSRSAGIPTGWDVVLDLSRKLAAMMGEDCGDDPAAWYNGKFGCDPDYSKLLDELCKTPTERQQLLRAYFEPSEDERERGLKQPTKAHRAIAKLMVQGFIRVVLTTNFDRLLELAIQEEGMVPVVISTADGMDGAMPLAHQRCCVVKLHGDYHDTRIKNTPAELGEYDARADRFLDQVLDQFGLVVCGWSAQWDFALRGAIERCPSRRFTLYWGARGEPSAEAMKLLTLRAGIKVDIADADAFFSKLADLVQGLEQSNAPHPASLEALAAITKRYLSQASSAISLADLVHEEVEAARKRVEELEARLLRNSTNADWSGVLAEYRNAIARIQTVIIHGCAFGAAEHVPLWTGAIQRFARVEQKSGPTLSVALRTYPAIVLLYSAGLAALATRKIDTAAAVLTKPTREHYGEIKPFIVGSFWAEVGDLCKTIPGLSDKYVPKSEHLFSVLRTLVQRYLPDDYAYAQRFDEFEYLLAMVYLDLDRVYPSHNRHWAPPARFFWRATHEGKRSVLSVARRELDEQQQLWPPLRAGLFESKPERAKELQGRLGECVERCNFY